MSTKGVELTLGWNDKAGEVNYSVSGNFSYTPNKIDKYKGVFQAGYDENGNWKSNIGDVASSSSAVDPIIEGNMKKSFISVRLIKVRERDTMLTVSPEVPLMV